jgi:hypothetical protein
MHLKQRQTVALRRGNDAAVRCVLLLMLGISIGYSSSQWQLRGGSTNVHVRVQQANRRLPQVQQQPRALQQPQEAADQHPPIQTLAASGRLYIATAANSAYFGGLTNLIGSLRYW